MRVKKKCEIQIWRASPGDVKFAQWRELTGLLDLAERSNAFKLRQDADRKVYILAHGLRRLGLAAMLKIAPEKLVFQDDKNGKPQLIQPAHHPVFQPVYFSHSHTRKGAIFAASTDVTVGVDVESTDTKALDFALLSPFVACSDAALTDNKNNAAVHFYRHWTSLEAFFKALGTGLLSSNPRLRFLPDSQGHWRVQFESPHTADMAALASRAVVMPITSPLGCVASLAIVRPAASHADNSFFEPASEDIALVIHEKDLTDLTPEDEFILYA